MMYGRVTCTAIISYFLAFDDTDYNLSTYPITSYWLPSSVWLKPPTSFGPTPLVSCMHRALTPLASCSCYAVRRPRPCSTPRLPF